MQIKHVAPSALKPYPRNARTHSRRQLKQIVKSIERFGFTNPVLVDDDLTILAGHGRVEAAKARRPAKGANRSTQGHE
jgi:ParB-like chromosome segregation protein Spo0J